MDVRKNLTGTRCISPHVTKGIHGADIPTFMIQRRKVVRAVGTRADLNVVAKPTRLPYEQHYRRGRESGTILRRMALIALTSVDRHNARRYVDAIEPLEGDIRLLMPGDDCKLPTERLMEGASALLLSGGPDVDPSFYGASPDPDAELYICRALDDLEFRLLDHALQRDMPVLAICRGMQVLNVAFGGRLIQNLPGHRAEQHDGRWVSATHQIYLSPGSKAAPIIGSAGFFRVNSRHHQGMREAQRAPRLMTTGYSVEDGLIEGLESPEHSWVIGVQCHPERHEEVPSSFANIFQAFKERAEMYHELPRV